MAIVRTKSLGLKTIFVRDLGFRCLNSGFGPKPNTDPLKYSASDLRPKGFGFDAESKGFSQV